MAYDETKRPTSISLGTAGSISQSFDRAGRITSDARSLTGISGDAGTGTQSFTYDSLSRLTSGTLGSASRTYQYDLDGNRTQKVEGTTTTDYLYDRADQVKSQTITGLATKTFDYDRYGNLTSGWDNANAQTTYAYDEANRLTTIAPPGGAGNQVTFTLDALDRHKTRSVGGTTADTYGYVDATETAWQVGNATTTSSLLDAEGTRLAVKTGSTVSWLLFDLHGSVAAICPAASTTLSDAYRYDGFGQQIASSGSVTNPWRYRGLLNLTNDFGVGALLDMGARDYAPQLGVFTQQDSVAGGAANPMTMNRFLYALANPATLIDPDGHRAAPLDECGGLCYEIDPAVWEAAEEAKRIESVHGDVFKQTDPVGPALAHFAEGAAWWLTFGFFHQSKPNLVSRSAPGVGIGLDAASMHLDDQIDAIRRSALSAQGIHEAQLRAIDARERPGGRIWENLIPKLRAAANRFMDKRMLGIANDIRRLRVFGEVGLIRGMKVGLASAGFGFAALDGYLDEEEREVGLNLPEDWRNARKFIRAGAEGAGDLVGGYVGGASCAVGGGLGGTAVALGCSAWGAQAGSQAANGVVDAAFDIIDGFMGYK